MKISSHFSKSILYFLLLGFCGTAVAQKTNNVQEGNFKAPAGIKIDGKTAEWGDDLQAYNKSTKLWYTLANDDQNIYLVVRSVDFSNNNKILAGGISFSVNTTGKKRDKGAFVVTFPVVNRAGGGSGRGRGQRRGFGQQDTPDTASIVADHKQALAECKEISAIGFKEITDTLISIYNEYGIKAAADFDAKGNFSYELSIPLKMLGISVNDQKEIAYNVKVNGFQLGGGAFMAGRAFTISDGGGGGRNAGFGGGGFGGGRASADMVDMMSPTDFWGKYTLFTPNASAR